jgi:hypothetical protein
MYLKQKQKRYVFIFYYYYIMLKFFIADPAATSQEIVAVSNSDKAFSTPAMKAQVRKITGSS